MKYMYEKKLEEAKEEGTKHTIDLLEVDAEMMLYRMTHRWKKGDREKHLARWEETMEKMKYVCEVCGKTEIMTPEEAYQEGWDYPPFMGSYGVVSARTCPCCSMMKTAWAALILEKKQYEELTDIQKETIMRIKGEPYNMKVDD